MTEAARVDCPCCGASLGVPAGVAEGAEFACAHCGQECRNSADARAFKWSAVDPYLQAHGASRTNLWGGFVGSVAWVVVVAVLMVSKGTFDPLLVLAIGAPYLLLYAMLFRTRARVPAKVWSNRLWVGMGGYLLYLFGVFEVAPGWWDALREATGGGKQPVQMLAIGGVMLGVLGGVGIWRYRRAVKALPQST